MEAKTFLERLQNTDFFRDQVVEVKEIPAREAVCQNVKGGLSEPVSVSLGRQGINKLYSHQATAIEHIRDDKDIVIVTGTASGKTLCYTIPVMETLIEDSQATMLFIYPTKALAQDQLRGLSQMQDDELGIKFLAGAYDGDTPQNLRRKLRDGGNIILTNPDMLHQGILPHHARWNRFFTHLRYIVIDEVHAYRGVFGS
ncbi:MAG: DEAD/DEAH box helicase, partial [Verrucomicrobia bacterium]|nr:DEAD/DEAH box helicase [Verrucomicrobiota bacterium]